MAPLGLLPAAIILVALIMAVAVDATWPLDFMDVVFGSAWTIIDRLVGLSVGPILGRLAIPARSELTGKFMPKIAVLMPAVVTATLVASRCSWS